MEAVDIEQMEAVRNILAARISKRQADRERYRASA